MPKLKRRSSSKSSKLNHLGTLGFTASNPTQSSTKTRTHKMTRSKSDSKAVEDEGWTSASSANETPEKSPSESPRLTQSQSQPDLSSLPSQLKQLSVQPDGAEVEDLQTPKPSSSYAFNAPPRPLSITSTTSSKAPPSVFKMTSPLASVDTQTVAHAADSPQHSLSTINLQDNLAAKLGYTSSLGAITRQNTSTPTFQTTPAKSHLVISNFTPAGSQDLPPTPTYSKLSSNPNLLGSHTALRTFFHPQKDSLERCARNGKFDPPPKWFEPVKNNQHPFFHPRKPNQQRSMTHPRPKSMIAENTSKSSQSSTRNSIGQAISGVVTKNPINRVFSYND